MTTTSEKLVKGSLWLSLTRLIVNVLTTLSTFILARFLTPGDFGLVAIGTTLLLIVTSLTELSLTQALVRHETLDDSHLNTAWTLNAIRGFIAFALFTASAYPVADLYDDQRLAGIMIALGASILLTGLINPRLVVLQRQLIFRQEFILGVSQKLIGFVASVAVAVIFRSYWALVVGILISQLVNIVVSYLLLPFRPKFTLSRARELLSFSIWLSAGSIVNTLNWRFDLLLVGKFLGSSAVGNYSVGNNLAVVATREAVAPLVQTVYPSFASIKNDPGRLRAAYQRVQTLITAIALPAGIGMALVADRVVILALGPHWDQAVLVVQVLASVFALQTLGSLVQPLGMAKGQTRRLFMRDTQMFFVRVPIILVGLLTYGLIGVLIARVVTGILAACVNMTLIRSFIELPISKQIFANSRALLSVCGMAAVVFYASTNLPAETGTLNSILQLILIITAGAVTYALSNIALWLASGRPSGPETEAAAITSRIIASIKR